MLCLEEHLLHHDQKNFLLINYGTPPAVVLGKSNRVEDLVFAECQIPLIRRFSGGGTVVVDESTIFISWILNKDFCALSDVDRLFDWTIRLYQNSHPNTRIAKLETDYVLGDKKVGGTAQYVKKDRILHHTSFLFDYDPKKMVLLKNPQKAPTYRNQRDHNDFLTTLSLVFRTPDAFIHPVLEELKKQFILKKMEFLDILVNKSYAPQTCFIGI
jgi:lipoate-protein ligase A